jgi:hypothetical protein
MKAILLMTIVVILSAAMAGCWIYSRPDATAAGCQKTTYGIAVATTSTENCPPPDSGATPSSTAPPIAPPPLPPPATP